jgi:hypothetical protein
VVATVAGLVSLRTGGAGVAIVQTQVVGIAYLVAGAIAWRRRPDNATGPLLLGLPGLESISQLGVPDLPGAFSPLRLETPARVTD